MSDTTFSLTPVMDRDSASPVRDGAAPKAREPTKIVAHRRFPFWVAGVGLSLGIAATAVYLPQLYVQSTDDAYVQADTVPVVPKIAGYVTALHVNDNSRFHAGELLAEIDPRDFKVAVDSAEADLQTARATKANVERQLAEQADVVGAAEATVESDRATLQFAEEQLDRYGKLAKTGSGTIQTFQQAQSNRAERHAALQHDIAALAAAKDQIGVLQTQSQEADGSIARAEATLAQAKLNLSYTKIFAGSDGSVANRIVQVGTFVQPGQVMFSAVPNETYVMANFKETQIALIAAGERVVVRVDALGAQRLDGHIDSLQRGTGANFALLPPENATGNFVKVVQRIPVKIVLDSPADQLNRIAPGMSVEARVTTRSPPQWLNPLLGN